MQTIAIHTARAVQPPVLEPVTTGDPLADLELAVNQTPTGQAIAPEELARFHQAGADEVHYQMLHDWGTMPAAQLNRQRVHLAEHPEYPAFVECLKALPHEGKPRVLSDFSYLI